MEGQAVQHARCSTNGSEQWLGGPHIVKANPSEVFGNVMCHKFIAKGARRAAILKMKLMRRAGLHKITAGPTALRLDKKAR